MEIKHQDKKEQYVPPVILEIAPVTTNVVKGESFVDPNEITN